MVHNKELKPPPELVDAIQESGDMTAPPTSEAAAPIGGHNVPRAIRNRLAHEEPQQMTEEQREALEERAAGGDHSNFLSSKEERQAHMHEVQKAQESAIREDRNHLPAGKAGGGATQVEGAASIMCNERPGGKGPHYRSRNSHHQESRGQH